MNPGSLASAAPTPGASGSDAAGQIGIRLLDAPTSAADDPRARAYIVDDLPPGTTITRHVGVSNTTDSPVEVSLYATAASIANDEFTFADGRTSNELTSWTSVSPSAISLAPGATATATVRIAVPNDASTGERYGVIWAQVSSAPAGGGVTQVNRVGVRMYLAISGSIQESSFEITGITAGHDSSGHPLVTVGVHNTGPRAVDVSGQVDLSKGPGGLRTGAIKTTKAITLPPGGRGSVSAPFDSGIPAGPWLATVDLSSGTLHRRATATLTFPAIGQVSAQLHKRSSVWLWVWVGVGVVVGAGLVAGAIRWRTHRAALAGSTRAGSTQV